MNVKKKMSREREEFLAALAAIESSTARREARLVPKPDQLANVYAHRFTKIQQDMIREERNLKVLGWSFFLIWTGAVLYLAWRVTQ